MKTSSTRRQWWLAAVLLAPLGGCGDDGGAADTGAETGTSTGGDSSEDDGGCVPLTCLDIDAACGRYDDGCGGTFDCEAGCACTPQTAVDDCPARPCEEVAGCEDSKCVYAPVTCGGSACVCRGDECEQWTLRSCGEATCSEQFCDPQPMIDGAGTHYANACVDAPMVGACGICGLGSHVCDPMADTLLCRDLDLVEFLGVDPDAVECDSTLPTSSFVFVDTESNADTPDGSRTAPFRTYDEAIAMALAGDALAIIIAGSPVFRSRPLFAEGVSVLGGFDGAPYFRGNADNRPMWEVGIEHMTDEEIANKRVVGGFVADVNQPTLFANIDIRTDDLSAVATDGGGWSNHGLVVRDSPGLRLVRVAVEAGSAGHGLHGADGAQGAAGLPGGAGDDALPCTCMAQPPDPPYQHCHGVLSAGGGAFDSPCAGDNALSGGGAGGVLSPPSSLLNCIAVSGEYSPGGTIGGFGGSLDVNPGNDGPDAPSVPLPQGSPGMPELRPGLTPEGVLFSVPSTAAGATGVIGAVAEGGSGGASGVSGSLPFLGCFTPASSCSSAIIGGGGGGGGGGGCGGYGGEGGTGGGTSVALSIANSTGMVVEDSSFVAGAGGRGGDGGQAGPGGPGGAAGAGGTVDPAACTGDLVPICGYFNAAPGGSGGTGGPGSPGGNGAGGSAYGAYCHDSALTVRGTVAFSAQTAGDGGTAGSVLGLPGVAVDQFACKPVCGNGVREVPEQCDDANTKDGDGCEGDCTLACGAEDGAIGAGFDPSSGACMAGFDTLVAWGDAEVNCANLGGHLVSVATPAEMALAEGVMHGRSFHIGLSDQTEEGVFVWQTGDELGDTDWCSGAPYGGDERNCVFAYWSDASSGHCWIDASCDLVLPYVCEY